MFSKALTPQPQPLEVLEKETMRRNNSKIAKSRPVDGQLVLPAVLHHPVHTSLVAQAQLIALIDGVPHRNPQL